MSCRYLEKVLSKQGNSKTIVRCLEDVLCRLGLMLIERWKFCLNKQGFAGALLMDLSKAFDTINHELLIAKLHAYGFFTDVLEVLLSYLQDRWQRVKINRTFCFGVSYFKEFYKDQFLVLYCSIFTSTIYFLH